MDMKFILCALFIHVFTFLNISFSTTGYGVTKKIMYIIMKCKNSFKVGFEF